MWKIIWDDALKFPSFAYCKNTASVLFMKALSGSICMLPSKKDPSLSPSQFDKRNTKRFSMGKPFCFWRPHSAFPLDWLFDPGHFGSPPEWCCRTILGSMVHCLGMNLQRKRRAGRFLFWITTRSWTLGPLDGPSAACSASKCAGHVEWYMFSGQVFVLCPCCRPFGYMQGRRDRTEINFCFWVPVFQRLKRTRSTQTCWCTILANRPWYCLHVQATGTQQPYGPDGRWSCCLDRSCCCRSSSHQHRRLWQQLACRSHVHETWR